MQSETSPLFYGLLSLPDQRIAPLRPSSDEARASFEEAARELLDSDLQLVAVPQEALDELDALTGGV